MDKDKKVCGRNILWICIYDVDVSDSQFWNRNRPVYVRPCLVSTRTIIDEKNKEVNIEPIIKRSEDGESWFLRIKDLKTDKIYTLKLRGDSVRNRKYYEDALRISTDTIGYLIKEDLVSASFSEQDEKLLTKEAEKELDYEINSPYIKIEHDRFKSLDRPDDNDKFCLIYIEDLLHAADKITENRKKAFQEKKSKFMSDEEIEALKLGNF